MIYIKRILFFALALLLFILGCKKLNIAKSDPIVNSVIGKWTYTEYFYSIGGAGQWHPIVPTDQTIEFKPDGSFISADSFLKGANQFNIIDSVTIKFQPASTPSGYILMGYLIKTPERELYLYPVNPMCIEGCSNKFKR